MRFGHVQAKPIRWRFGNILHPLRVMVMMKTDLSRSVVLLSRRRQEYNTVMGSRDIQDGIQNELRRVQIQNHSNFSAWYSALKPYARQIIDLILEEDLRPEYIIFARDAPEEEWEEYQFISIIAGGNPRPSNMPALTNFVLGDILIEVEDFGKES